ncbi:unnamed protein product [Adineta ricciae]|uniref:Uncharacterized protein n=1 Tax=Adineta ricciae TaxID=249248 RepID=A0A815E000_ADIRI|nr:unnamed protein product [Adineta ricciae]
MTKQNRSTTSMQDLRELCSKCGKKPYHEHMQQLGQEFRSCYAQVGERLLSIGGLNGTKSDSSHGFQAIIDHWRRQRHQDIDAIADQALMDYERQANFSTDISEYRETYAQLADSLESAGHDELNKILELNNQIQERVNNVHRGDTSDCSSTTLDATLQAKLQPSVLHAHIRPYVVSTRTDEFDPPSNRIHTRNSFENRSSFSISETVPEPVIRQPTVPVANNVVRTEAALSNNHAPVQIESVVPNVEAVAEPPAPQTAAAATAAAATAAASKPAGELSNGNRENGITTDTTFPDDLDCGKTDHIQRTNPLIIPTTSEKYAGTICCHNKQLLYNTYDKVTDTYSLFFINDVTNPSANEPIAWTAPDHPIDGNDNDWIQDISYSDVLSGYLILNRTRLRLYKPATKALEEFHLFAGRTMRRISCCQGLLYLTSIHGTAAFNGDEILIMDSNKVEQACKTLRDIFPPRLNRGGGALPGEISDIAVANNEHAAIGYRLERRHEVGICIFKLTNDGKEWTFAKQLVLNDCWVSDLSYTPRVDWCQKLQVYILIEYITGHLIMLSQDGEVEGECQFTHPQNRRDSPINLTVSQDCLGVRYGESINIHQIQD